MPELGDGDASRVRHLAGVLPYWVADQATSRRLETRARMIGGYRAACGSCTWAGPVRRDRRDAIEDMLEHESTAGAGARARALEGGADAEG